MSNRIFEGKVSLIIPTYNKAPRLTLVLESLKNMNLSNDQITVSLEVILVNDGSTDETMNILNQFKQFALVNRSLEVKVIDSVNKGRSAARNIGMGCAEGEILIFTDDDLLLSNEFVINHVKWHLKNEKIVVHGKIYSLPHLKFISDPTQGIRYDGRKSKTDSCILKEMLVREGLNNYLSKYAKISKFERDILELFKSTCIEESKVRWIGFTGGNISLKRNSLKITNIFDENMGIEWGCEDLEFGYRLYLDGFQFVYDEYASNYHLNHYRENHQELHDNSFKYFEQKHSNEEVILLKKYFNSEYQSLLEWREQIVKGAQ